MTGAGLIYGELDVEADGVLRCKICGKRFRNESSADRHVMNESRKVTLALARFWRRQARRELAAVK